VGDNCAAQLSGARHSLLLLSPSSQPRVAGVEQARILPLRDASENSEKNKRAPSNRRAYKHARSRKLPVSDQHVRRRPPILKCYLVLRSRPHRNQPFRSLRLQMKVPDRQKEYRQRKRPNQRATQQNCPRNFHFVMLRRSSRRIVYPSGARASITAHAPQFLVSFRAAAAKNPGSFSCPRPEKPVLAKSVGYFAGRLPNHPLHCHKSSGMNCSALRSPHPTYLLDHL
jgi:hypothetical protein